ncbi:hypothetical protein N9L06_03705 [Mariniblastus sp.]|nr:hypothetical protein [Mariniblastus sp.]
MNNVCFKLTSTVVSACLAWSALVCQPAAAQSLPKPAAVISIANLDDTLADIDYLVDASGFGQMKFMIQTQITHFLKGVDPTRPSGVLLYMDEGAEQPTALGFVPVEELDDLLDTLSGFAEVDEGDDYTTIITDDGNEILIKQVGNHAFISDKAEMFQRIPDVPPASLLGDLPTRFNVAARLFGQQIPKAMREKAITTIQDAYEKQLEQLESGDEDSAQAALQRTSYEINMKQIKDLILETDQLAFGMLIDEENKTLSSEIEIIGTENSTLAKRAAANMNPEKSRFTGFVIPNATFTAISRTNLIEEDLEQYTQLSETGIDAIVKSINEESDLTAEEVDAIKKAMADLSTALLETMKEGVTDAGLAVTLGKGDVNLAGGFAITDPKKVEQVAKDLAAEFEGKLAELGTVKLNSGAHKDVTFHTFTLKTPEDTEELIDAVGEQIQIVIGIGPQETYFAAGSSPSELLIRAIDGNGTVDVPATLGMYKLYIAPIVDFVATIQPDDFGMAQKMADALTAGGRDQLQYELKPLKNGFSIRGDLQDGVLELIQVATEAMAQPRGQGGNF